MYNRGVDLDELLAIAALIGMSALLIIAGTWLGGLVERIEAGLADMFDVLGGDDD